jgi:hypothetical protein
VSNLNNIDPTAIENDVLSVESMSVGIGGIPRHAHPEPAKTPALKEHPKGFSIRPPAAEISLYPASSALLHSAVRSSSRTTATQKKLSGNQEQVHNQAQSLQAQKPAKIKRSSRRRALKKAQAKLKASQQILAANNSTQNSHPAKLSKPQVQNKPLARESQPATAPAKAQTHAEAAKTKVQAQPQQKVQTPKKQLAIASTAQASKPAQPVKKASLPSQRSASFNPYLVSIQGLKYAAQFNRHAQSTLHKTLASDIESAGLFTKSVDNELAIRSTTKKPAKKLLKYYNISKASKTKMIGGVQQHDIERFHSIKRIAQYRPVRALGTILLLLSIGAYLFYLNLPTARLKTAAKDSGISVVEPSYTPEGYSLKSPLASETGKVAMAYTKDGGPSYLVTQEVNNWDSKALLENKVSKESKEYNTYVDRGLTIYVYNGKAVWMNQGKLNQIDGGSANLPTEDLIRIAGSM